MLADDPTIPEKARATASKIRDQARRTKTLVGNLLSYGGLVVGQQENERILLELIQAGVEDDKMRELFAPLLDHEDFDLLRQVQILSLIHI